MDAHFFNKGQLLDLAEAQVRKEEAAEDVEVEGIDVATWKKKNGLCGVPQEHKSEVLRQYYDGQVAGY